MPAPNDRMRTDELGFDGRPGVVLRPCGLDWVGLDCVLLIRRFVARLVRPQIKEQSIGASTHVAATADDRRDLEISKSIGVACQVVPADSRGVVLFLRGRA